MSEEIVDRKSLLRRAEELFRFWQSEERDALSAMSSLFSLVKARRQAILASDHLREAAGLSKRAAGFGSCNSSSRTRALLYAASCHAKAADHLESAVAAIRAFASLV